MKEDSKINIGFVVSEFNYDITYLMLQRALEHAKFLGANVEYVFRVPGAYDMPLAIKNLLLKKNIDGLVALGAIIQGETKHDEIVAQQVSRKITDLSLEYGKPVSLGISGPGMTRLQGAERIDDFSKRSVEAVIKMIRRIKESTQIPKNVDNNNSTVIS